MTATNEIVTLSTQEFNELCRLCASKTNVLVGLPIFEDEGDTRQIFKKIRACLPVQKGYWIKPGCEICGHQLATGGRHLVAGDTVLQVASTDRLPKMVCEECVYKLDLLFEFRERSVRTERYLESILPKVAKKVTTPNGTLSSTQVTSSIVESSGSPVRVTPVATATLTLTTPVLLLAPLSVSRTTTAAPVVSHVGCAQNSAHILPMQVQPVTLLHNHSRASCVVDRHTNGMPQIQETYSQAQVASHQLMQEESQQGQLQHSYQQPHSNQQQLYHPRQPDHHHIRQESQSAPPHRPPPLPPPQTVLQALPPHQLPQHLNNHCHAELTEQQDQNQSVQNARQSLVFHQQSKHHMQEQQLACPQVKTVPSSGWCSATQPAHQELQCEPDVFIKIEEHEIDVSGDEKVSSGGEDDDSKIDNGDQGNADVPQSIPDGSGEDRTIVTGGQDDDLGTKCTGSSSSDNVTLSVLEDFSKPAESVVNSDASAFQQSTSPPPVSKPTDFCCKTCDNVFTNQEELDKHNDGGCTVPKANEPPKDASISGTSPPRKKWQPKVCSECGKEYRTNYKLREHMRRHTGERPFRCSLCPKAFRSKIGLAQHEARHTGQFEFSCDSCGKGFQCKSYLIVHQRVHSDEKPYPCSTCGRRFKMRQSLLDHQNRHLGVKPYLCETCGRRFVTKALCKSHQRIHSGADNRRHPCSVCGKMFVSKSYLATHLRIHTGEKPFMCEVCGKGFLTRVDLRIHATIHTGEKSFQCEWCGKAFARRDALRCHRRSHTGERPYTCDVCGQSFTQFSPLTIHKRLHTGERPYACDICSKGFVSRSTMRAHQKKCCS